MPQTQKSTNHDFMYYFSDPYSSNRPTREYLVERKSALLPDGPMGDLLLRLEPQVLQHVSPLILHDYRSKIKVEPNRRKF